MASISPRTRTAGRTETRRGTLEQLLERQQATLEAGRERLRDSGRAESSEVHDAEEHSVDGMQSGVNVALLELSSRAANGIEAALLRLRAGTFGRCADCGSMIAPRRLQAVFFAERCRGCQEANDAAAERTIHDEQREVSPRRARATSGH